MWSVGVILYILLCGQPPFRGTDDEVITSVKKGKFAFEPQTFWKSISNSAKDLVQKLIVKGEDERLTAEQALRHPWIADNVNTARDENLALRAIQSLSEVKVSRAIILFFQILITGQTCASIRTSQSCYRRL